MSPAVNAARPGTIAQHAVEGLRRALTSGELSPGDKVRQEEIADALGTSLSPVREALAVLEQEGQVTYLPRRGYFVTELRMADLEEIYALRRVLEGRAAREALPAIGPDAMVRIEAAAADCGAAAAAGDVAGELAANRRFHFAILEAPGNPHAMRIIRVLWDSTEAYRALYYNSPEERGRSLEAHERILDALRAGDADRLVAELDAHRDRALAVLRDVLAGYQSV